MQNFSFYIVPIVVLFIVSLGFFKKVPLFEKFTEGAKNGLASTVSIAPALIGLIVAVSMIKASGALDMFTNFIRPLTECFGIPGEVVPLMFLRPISGSGSLAIIDSIFKSVGPDSFPGRLASIIMGSTETTFYAIAVYFGSVGIKNTRHAVPAALIADICGFFIAVLVTTLFFH